jgi:hypothetical protein
MILLLKPHSSNSKSLSHFFKHFVINLKKFDNLCDRKENGKVAEGKVQNECLIEKIIYCWTL